MLFGCNWQSDKIYPSGTWSFGTTPSGGTYISTLYGMPKARWSEEDKSLKMVALRVAVVIPSRNTGFGTRNSKNGVAEVVFGPFDQHGEISMVFDGGRKTVIFKDQVFDLRNGNLFQLGLEGDGTAALKQFPKRVAVFGEEQNEATKTRVAGEFSEFLK